MRMLAAIACLGMLVVSVAVACGSDDGVKHLSDGGSAGVGDGGLGGADGVGQGGGSSNPAAGGGGAPQLGGDGLGGAPEVNGNGGTGAPSPLEEGGTFSVGGGGSPAVDCPAQRQDSFHPCGEVQAGWAPLWNDSLGRFELDVSTLPFAIASGTISYFYSNADFQSCGTAAVDVSGAIVSAAPTNLQFSPIAMRITTFSLVDVCGNHRDYSAGGVESSCTDLRATGDGFGNEALACSSRVDTNCPEACN
jgi:hypothetical protein